MNPTNRPVDFLLNIESPSINLAQRRNSGASNNQSSELSALNRKENSFEDVYRQQRREDGDVRQPAQQKRSSEQPVRADHRSSQAQQSAPVKQAKADNKHTEDGKPLPQASAENHAQEVSTVVRGSDAERAADDGQTQSLVMVDDVEVAVSFDVSELTPVASDVDDIAATVAAQQSGELAADTEQSASQGIENNLDVGLAADPIEEFNVYSEQQAEVVELDVKLAENIAPAPAREEQVTDAEQALNQEQALPDEEAVILQARQAETVQQQGAAKTAEVDPAARAAQVSTAAADVAREFKQNRLGEAIENSVKGDINTATASKTSASGNESAGQPTQDRLAQLTAAMDFKVLREQLAAGTVKVDGALAGAAKGVTLDATSAADGAADRQPRLNSLTQAAQALTQAKPGVVSASVQPPVGSPEWGQAMSQRIMWLANRGISAAELQLNPRDLGPVDVRINVNGEQTTVQFSSPNVAVREALESSVVRLREMMESSGLNLADVDVSDQSQSEQAQADARDESARDSAGENDDLDSAAETVATQRIESDGLVDFYA